MEYGDFSLFLEIKNSLIEYIESSDLASYRKDIILGTDGQVGVYQHSFHLMNKWENGMNNDYEIEKIVDEMKDFFDVDVVDVGRERYETKEKAVA